ncbi:MAG: iron-containing alcohol dehydrogenase [Firmicutes bacterium]|nr:iron-containing alcohol dehydrogenase [Bacillota bacterium]
MPSGAGAGIANGSDVEALARGAPHPSRRPPVLAVPTTAGSGSEVTPYASLTFGHRPDVQGRPAGGTGHIATGIHAASYPLTTRFGMEYLRAAPAGLHQMQLDRTPGAKEA